MAADVEEAGEGAEEDVPGEEELTGEEEPPYWVEIWNEYDPSMRFVVIFPVGEKEGATESSVAYYIIEPGKHTGLHSDNAEEIVFVAEGEGEVFSIGSSKPLSAGQFHVFPAGSEHDIYAKGSDAMRLLSFFPTTEIISTFQQVVYPVATTELSSKPPKPVVHELDPNNLPEGFPFSLEDLGMAGEAAQQPELSETQRLLGMTEPGKPPEKVKVTIYTPSEGTVESYTLGKDGKRIEEGDEVEEQAESAPEPQPEAESGEG